MSSDVQDVSQGEAQPLSGPSPGRWERLDLWLQQTNTLLETVAAETDTVQRALLGTQYAQVLADARTQQRIRTAARTERRAD